jgi:DNA invertase Pin-like site-specific DNA recombinase
MRPTAGGWGRQVRLNTETASGARHDRPVLDQLLGKLEKGDVLVTFKLDRLGRSLAHLVKVLAGLGEA